MPTRPVAPDERLPTVWRWVDRRPAGAPHGGTTLSPAPPVDGPAAALLAGDEAPPDPTCAAYLDTETNGIAGGAGTRVLLAGVARWRRDGDALRLETTQLALVDLADERPFLRLLADALAGASCVVSFNGKGFDAPRIATRAALAGRPDPLRGLPHVDLLPIARARWSAERRSCALAALERDVFGLDRGDDVAGAAIPPRLRAFLSLASADEEDEALRAIDGVRRHNLIDVLSTVAMHGELARWLTRDDEPARDATLARRAADRAAGERRLAALSADADAAGRSLTAAERDALADRLSGTYTGQGGPDDVDACWRELRGLPQPPEARPEEHPEEHPEERPGTPEA